MPLLTAKNLCLNIGRQALLDHISFTLEPGERVCLLGRNGEGKSTLLRVILGEATIESGEIQHGDTLRLATLPQDVPPGTAGTVFDVVAEGLGDIGRVLAAYHHLLHDDPTALERMGQLQEQIDTADGWNLDARVESTLSRLNLSGEADFAALSGGMKRRVLLAQALVREPDLLLLDEPTNHLDVDSITWLEDFLRSWNGTVLFITHDRAFLRRLATRILELDRGHLTSWPGDYDTYLRRKQEALDAEEQANALFDKKLAQEEVWIRKGIQARRTRNEGRVRALLKLREEAQNRRKRSGSARIVLQEAERSGKLVVEAENVSLAFAGQPVIADFSTTILRGDRVGIIGPNGAGKTTLLNVLLGKIAPDAGDVREGTRWQLAYFDQLRAALDPDQPVFDAIGDGRDFVEINGAPKHVLSYLQEFLFTPERARSPVRALSGGERARLLLARLFAQPCNVLVLDEPTNDLDLETLDLLEERLLEFPGTVFLVSHDREFLDRVVSRSLVAEGHGRWGDYVGGYSDWLRQRPASTGTVARPIAKAVPVSKATAAAPSVSTSAVKPLTSAERRELQNLPPELEALEAEQAQLAGELADPALFRKQPDRAQGLQQRLAALAETIAARYARWEALDARANG
ncbi:MAG: ATP-binding cassette domain-containing protein [Oceanococcaceae bacterium]